MFVWWSQPANVILHEPGAAMRGDEVARDDARVTEGRRAVVGMLIRGEAEDLVCVGRVDQPLRLAVEGVHVRRVLSQAAPGAVNAAVKVDGVEEIPAIAQARTSVRMRERGESGGRRL